MASGDVVVKIIGNAKDLMKAVRDSERELRKLENAAKKAGKEGGDAIGTDLVKGASKANVAVKVLGGVIGGVVLTGALGVATTAASLLGDKLLESFNESKQAAEDAAAVFESAFSSVFSGIQSDLDKIGFGNKGQLLDALRLTRSEIADLERGQVVTGKVSAFGPGVTLTPQSEDARKARIENEKILAILKIEETFYDNQLKSIDAQAKIRTRLLGLGAGIDVKLASSSANIGGGSDLVEENGQPGLEKDLELFEKMRIARVAFAQAEQKLTDILREQQSVQAENSMLSSEAADLRMRELQAEIDLEQGLVEAQALANAMFDEAISAVDTFGSSGIDALADIIVGFESLKDIGDIVANVFRGLVKDLIVASSKAAILTAITGGVGAVGGGKGFGSFFKSFLGLTPFASGGIVTGPTPALVGEAGPEAIIPLDKLGSFGSRRLEIVPTVLAGGDILIGLREANNTLDGLGGRISI